ncbi:filamentous hemagglutinin N-terminal domain-containing protein, partial [Poseidonibacter lekithochrous]|uniref:beta strand repeat-containing protein n=1 Tax=Poseidonibacter TaxID=2321187 RepID=UPI001C086C3A
MKRLIDFSSRFRILKGGKISLVVSALLGSVVIASASPSGGTVTSGTANISQSGKVTNIDQSSSKASINWQNFDIATDETVNFNQPDINSITLNRVVGNESSVINGALNANGQVWLLNSNGVLFGKNASINTAGILATTGELSDSDFQAGNYKFKNNSENSVINLGAIEVSNNGYVVLASNEVRNSGTIKAVKGKVHLTAASEYTVNLNGNSLVNLVVNKGVLDAMVENSGTILADGGEVYLTTNAVNELLKGVVNNTGIIEANSLDGLMGNVELFAHGGEVQVGGTIEAKDGFVETSGKDFTILEDATITADEWLIDPVNVNIDDTLATTIETALGTGDVTIETETSSSSVDTSSNESGSDGDINVNSEIEWSTAKTLTLNAHNDININESITATNDDGKLALYYGQANVNTDNESTYNVNAAVNLKAGDNFITKLGNDADINPTTWTVITELGSAGSTTGTDLQGINKDSTSLYGNYVLGADIDARDTSTWNEIDDSEEYNGFDPLGDNSTQFKGNFDGLGHTISNLTINRPNEDSLGLFGRTNGATIKNIGVTNVSIIGEDYIGGLVGFNTNTSTIEKSYVSGTVDGILFIGGLVGNNSYSTIENSYANGTVSGTNNIGGLVGNNNNSTIKNSYASGTVSGEGNSIGGLLGYNNNSEISNSYYDNEANKAEMSDSDTYGKTKAEIVTAFTDLTDSPWTTSENDSSVKGYGVLVLPYLTSVTKDEDKSFTTLFEGGMGTDESAYTITNWTQLQNINNSNILSEGYYFSLLNNLSSATSDYTNLASSTANDGKGWDPIGDSETNSFKGTFDGLGNTISDLYINNTDSYVGLFGYTSGATIQNIGVINTNITNVGNKGWGDYGFAQGNSGNYSTVGALIGSAISSVISNSYSSGTISSTGGIGGTATTNAGNGGNSTVGGLIGSVSTSSISNSYSSASVTGIGGLGGTASSTAGNGGNSIVGGLIGSVSTSSISNSYSSASVTGTGGVGGTASIAGNGGNSTVGGLIGETNDEIIITNSYASGTVNSTGGSKGTVTNNYYDDYIGFPGYYPGDYPENLNNSSNGSASKGGLIGINNNTLEITNSFYDKTKNPTGMSDVEVSGITGLTTKEMSYGGIYKTATWDIVADSTVTQNTPVIKYDSDNDKYYWAISPLSLSYTLATDKTSIYNGNTLSSFFSKAFGDDYSFLDGDYKFQKDSKDVTGYKNAGIYDGIQVASTNEFLTVKNTGNTDGKLTITPKEITVSATATDKTYDATTAATTTLASSDIISGDTVTLGGTATFADKNVGTNKTVNITGLELGGTDKNNYNLITTTATTTADISKKALTISGLTSANKIYDGTTDAIVNGTASLQAFQTVGDGTSSDGKAYIDDEVSLSGTAIGTFNDKDVADATTVSFTGLSLSGSDKENYSLTKHTNGEYTITPKEITSITGITASNKTYDASTNATLNTTNSSFTGIVENDTLSVVNSIGAFTDKNVGTNKTVNITGLELDGTDKNNYNLTTTTAQTEATITAREVTVSATATDKTYDGTTAADVTLSEYVNNVSRGISPSGLIKGDDVSFSGTATFADKNVGVDKNVTVSDLGKTGKDASNYTIANETAETKATIEKANATVTANSDTVTYNGLTQTVSGFTASGLVNGETISVLDGVSA